MRAFSRVQTRGMRSLPPAEVAIASILAFSLWALQTRSWRRSVAPMKTARINPTNRASHTGGTTPREHRADARRQFRRSQARRCALRVETACPMETPETVFLKIDTGTRFLVARRAL